MILGAAINFIIYKALVGTTEHQYLAKHLTS